MTVKEKLQGLIKLIDTLNPNSDIFNFIDSTLLDVYYYHAYGNRKVTPLVNHVELETVAKVVADRYLKKWDNIILNYLDSNKILDSYKEVVTETIAAAGTNTINRTETDKVSAYNTDEFVNDTENSTSENNANTNDTTRELIRTKVKDSGFYSTIHDYLIKFDIYNIIVTDINELLTLQILG